MSKPTTSGEESSTAIQVENLEKTFRIPTHRVNSFKERIVRPFASRDYRTLRALDGISFEVKKGEFFGIVGRNGSGKSTLLKLLASIYRPDRGRIRMAGRLAPFIELGVGFNLELTARENVVLNGVMMGLTPNEAHARLDAVLDFAELNDFVDLKLKNYSSGMLVRLAFSLMLEVDADILLIDEVLAVGDAAFQQKCGDEFRKMKAAGKTVVLVTHEMSTVEEFCHRALLINDGHIEHAGDPAEVGRRYVQLNFEKEIVSGQQNFADTPHDEIRLVDIWLEAADGTRLTNVERLEPLRLRLVLETMRDSDGIGVGFMLVNADGIGVFQFGVGVTKEHCSTRLTAGERVHVDVDLANPLMPGRYFIHTGINRVDGTGVALYVHNSIGFVVYGGDTHTQGIVSIPYSDRVAFERVREHAEFIDN